MPYKGSQTKDKQYVVQSGEVQACACVALRGPGAADIGSVAPLEARRALSCSGGNCPWLAPPRDANKCNRHFEQLLGHRGLLHVLDLNLQGCAVGGGVCLR